MKVKATLCVAALSLFFARPVFAQQPAAPPPPAEKQDAPTPDVHKLGPLDFSVNWRSRTKNSDSAPTITPPTAIVPIRSADFSNKDSFVSRMLAAVSASAASNISTAWK